MSARFFFAFPGAGVPELGEVGGKGYSLIEGTRAGLPVPPGFVLATHFFEPWFKQLKKTEEWKYFRASEGKELKKAADALKKAATKLHFDTEQSRTIGEAFLQTKGDLFAVRSSSPNEDLEGASFAGGYETILGVQKPDIENAVRRCFASCLDHRVFVYMKESGFDVSDPKIAVVVQQQIGSEISGVGFSLNPVTNNFDEAVINANWGLGETVVAGQVTPDFFVVDTSKRTIVERSLGSKETSMWLVPGGGTQEKKDFRSADATLSDAQIFALADLIRAVEKHYGKPMDIEWAYAEGMLYLLQARPITAYVPLSPEMITSPGRRKRLYFDLSITAEGMTRPISYLGTSAFRRLIRVAGKVIFLRDITTNIDRAIAHISDGRIFVNVSTFFKIVGKKRLVGILNNIDPLAMRVVESLDERDYMPRVFKLGLLPYGVLLRLPRIIAYVLRAQRDPIGVDAQIKKNLSAFQREARAIVARDIPFTQMLDTLIERMFLLVFLHTIPLVLRSRVALARLQDMVGDKEKVDVLTRSLPHNITIEMGVALSKIAQLVPKDMSREGFLKKAADGSLPVQLRDGWADFLFLYGIRGPEEIDPAAPRYSEKPEMLIDLLFSSREGESAQALFDRGVAEREAMYDEIHGTLIRTSLKQAKRFSSEYRFLVNFGGYRESHKYYLVHSCALVREKLLTFGRSLAAEGKLDSPEQIFDLSLEQLDEVRAGRSMDLRVLANENTAFIRTLARITRPPALIDSRGLIPRPPVQALKEGEYAGAPISSGVVRGRVKVLHTPHEKPFEKGEILVARATDPGWTPLFVNAAGVILEVGGVLQHGALVAREYGLPCVAGIDRATEIWKDGQMVEVDGSQGIVRVIAG